MEDYQVKLNAISGKVELLVSRYNELRQEYGFLEEKNAELAGQNKTLKEQIKGEKAKQGAVEQELKQAKLTKMMVPQTLEEKTEMKRKVNDFIKEIDRCVAMLND
ncbi:MAG: hypothetical protein SH857_08160 [Chitinophagales bacterium]|nr:hypothetical protein [Chitinophagales bacterium]